MKCLTSRKYTLKTLSMSPMPSTNTLWITTSTRSIGIHGRIMLPNSKRMTQRTESSTSMVTSNAPMVEITSTSRGKYTFRIRLLFESSESSEPFMAFDR